MARYIDAEALEQDLERQYKTVFGNAKKKVNPKDFFIERNQAYYASMIEQEQKDFFDYLKSRPTADVVEVKHGKWIRTGWNSYKCSNCGGMFVGMAARDWNGCPNCLAKMDGK